MVVKEVDREDLVSMLDGMIDGLGVESKKEKSDLKDIWILETKNTKIIIELLKEPLETTYFNLTLSACFTNHEYVYNASEVEYSSSLSEVAILRNISQDIIQGKYRIVKRKVFLLFTKTYLDIAGEGYDVSMLEVK